MIPWLRSVIVWVKKLFAMRRKISLYIADQLVDLDDQSFVLFNYTMDDLSNPTIVKNSFSQQITLKGTPTNNKIFGDSFKTDRQVANMGAEAGVDFNASKKTPFTIYNEMNEILESGYVKLDSVTRKGVDIQYKVTLYGGLGSFFYALSYDENGNKRTLADLDYLGTSDTSRELNFVINARTVREAWANLSGNAGSSPAIIASRTYVRLASNGALISDPDHANYRVNDFYVRFDSEVFVTCTSLDGDYAGAVAMDENENVLHAYFIGEGESYADEPVTLPAGTYKLRVFGYFAGDGRVDRLPANPLWEIINFAPAYNGIPDGNFAPNKALVTPSDVGLRDIIVSGSSSYTTRLGYGLVNLAEAQDEWAVKDLRSYLQRPVFSMQAFWDAICNPENNGGYEVDASVIQDYMTFGKYASLWMTLPMISSLGSFKRETGDLTISMTPTPTSGNSIGSFNLSGSVPSGTRVSSNMNIKLRFNVSGANSYSELSPFATRVNGRNTETNFSVIFVQIVAYDSGDSPVGGSKVKVYPGKGGRNLESIAEACGYVPAWSAGYEMFTFAGYNRVSSGVFEIPTELSFSIDAPDVDHYNILVSVYDGHQLIVEGSPRGGGQTITTNYSGNGSTSTPLMFVNYGTSFTPSSAYIVRGSIGNLVTYVSSDSLRSGATITKAMLLSSSHTPAEYMLSFCKMFGLYFTYDNATKKVSILRRNDLYQDETIDLTKRVDLSKGIEINPLVFNAKWYDFILEGVGGAFYDNYQSVEGIPYGIQRVNTGYDFNADSVNLMSSVVFRNACTILARSKYFNNIFNGVIFQPSPFLDKGNTYTLWSIDGETLETDISCPPESSDVEYWNEISDYRGYDVNEARKLEFRDEDNKPIDGKDVLVFLEGWNSYSYFKVTDDVSAMDVLNDGVPCWLLEPGESVSIPIFQRYFYGNTSVIEDSLDFGYPLQMDIPGVRFTEGCSLYERGWKKYISDRYNVNTKVMTCLVNFSGIKVNQDLLRKFYWYDNSLWVLNKIKNYSLTTYDPVECEFVQVQDKDNYLNGQSY